MTKTVALYRMVTPKHICPYGIRSKDLLEREGYKVKDHHLTTRKATDAFKKEHKVDTTPQTFIDGERIGGFEDLVHYFGKTTLKQEGTTYQPVIAIFSTTLLMAVAVVYRLQGDIGFIPVAEYFIALSMCVLAIMKLRDLYSFTNQFLGYDLLAQRWVRYGYVYPFVEMLAGVMMLASWAIYIAAPAALVIGIIGGISVFKAVYIDKRELKCACVGGDSRVPLGFVSLTENIMMVVMATWMLMKHYN